MITDGICSERGDKRFLRDQHAFRKRTKKLLFKFPKFLACHQNNKDPDEDKMVADQVRGWLSTNPENDAPGGEIGYFTGRAIDRTVQQAPTCYARKGYSIVTIDIHVNYPYDRATDTVSKVGHISDYAEELLDFCEDETLILSLDETAEDPDQSWVWNDRTYYRKFKRTVWYVIVFQAVQTLQLDEIISKELGISVSWHGRRATIAGSVVGDCYWFANGTVLLDRVLSDIEANKVKTALVGGRHEQDRQVC